jgi:2-polyprenyl-3-methyl-5-hydroxy-6-metoxy-1,4-benzoquinol methylase
VVKELKSTSERINPRDEFRNPIYQQGIAIYKLISGYVKDKVVLDIGCGEGYGSFLLSEFASKVMAIDCSQEAIEHANSHYRKNNLTFITTDALNLPFSNGVFDAVCSIELIEHLKDISRMLSNIRNVLKPAGTYLLSTPNKDLSIVQNPYHYREFTEAELRDTLHGFFDSVLILGMHGSIRANRYFDMRTEASDRLKKLDIFHFRKLVTKPVMSPLYNFIGSTFSKSIYSQDAGLARSITPEDFYFDDENLVSAMNFVAICRA